MLIEKKFFPHLRMRLYTGAKFPNCNLNRKWYVEYYIDDKRHRIYGHINQKKTKDERLEAGIKLSKTILLRIQTDLDLKTRIMNHVVSRKYTRKKTRQDYISKIKVMIGFLEGKKLTEENLSGFFQHILHNRHEITYNKYLTVIRQMFTEIGFGHLVRDEKRVRALSTPAQYFQRHQVESILNKTVEDHPELFLCINFLYYTFIRPGELRQMLVSDIYFEERKILVRGEISKNKKSEFVLIPDCFMPMVAKLIHKRPGDYIIEHPRKPGEMVPVNFFGNEHRKILLSLGFDTTRFVLYSWKHTGAVSVAKTQVRMKSLQSQLRHHSLDQVDQYLRQMGVIDANDLKVKFPAITKTAEDRKAEKVEQLLHQLREKVLLKMDNPEEQIGFLQRVIAAI